MKENTGKENLKEWFSEFEMHLMEDEAPSNYFIDLLDAGRFPKSDPFSMISNLKNVPQQSDHHPEGDVFNHTMQVTDLAAGVKHRSADARAFMWAALLHDLGKLTTTKLRRGRITSYDHDVAGEKLAREFLQKCACDEALVTHVCALVRWHMQVMFISKNMPFADMPSMLASVDPGEVALLAYCDRLGRGKLSEKRIAQEKKDIETFLEKCAAVRPGITRIMTDQETTG